MPSPARLAEQRELQSTVEYSIMEMRVREKKVSFHKFWPFFCFCFIFILYFFITIFSAHAQEQQLHEHRHPVAVVRLA